MKNNNMIGIVVAILLLVGGITLYWNYTRTSDDGSGIALMPIDRAIEVFFADENLNEVTNPANELQSIVTVGAEEPIFNVFFTRFNINAENAGGVPITVSPVSFKAYDANGVEISSTSLTRATSCLTDEVPVIIPEVTCTIDANCGTGFKCNTLTSKCYKRWDSNPLTGNSGCSVNNWLSVVPLQREGKDGVLGTGDDIVQPVKFVVRLEGTYQDLLTQLNKHVVKEPELLMTITNSSFSYGGFEASFDTGTESYLKECTSGAVSSCPGSDIPGSSCYGISQTCPATGLWSGCTTNLFRFTDPTYNPGYEYTGGKALCKDNKDNDCDGLADRAGATSTKVCTVNADCYEGAGQTCVGATTKYCTLLPDADCPPCYVTMRTNAQIGCTANAGYTSWTCTNDIFSAYQNKFLILDLDGNGNIDASTENYGYTSAGSNTLPLSTSANCHPNNRVMFTPSNNPNLYITKKTIGARTSVYVCSVGATKADYYQFDIGAYSGMPRCKPGDTEDGESIYPECLNPLATAFWSSREKCEVYQETQNRQV